MKKILYLSHADWNWIKQRPQFLAEELSNEFKVVCVSPFFYNRKDLQKRLCKKQHNMKFYTYYGIPKAKKILFLRKFNNFLRNIITVLIAVVERPDVIYLCYPELYGKWMKLFKGLVMYDCMDDHVAMAHSSSSASYIVKKESELCRETDVVLCSSNNLKNKMYKDYHTNHNKIHIVRNGYQGKELVTNGEGKKKEPGSLLKIGYIGTVSSWFDFSIIEQSLKQNRDIEYHIIGPVDRNVKILKDERVIYEGVIEHDKLFNTIQDYDALVMPFVVNEIIKSVDPVKLYEYINFYKPIISVYYDEVGRFEPFVWFYSNIEEYNFAIDKIRFNEMKYTLKMKEEFLFNSSWKSRALQIATIINSDNSK